jgi:hypothetical protein
MFELGNKATRHKGNEKKIRLKARSLMPQCLDALLPLLWP